MNYNFYLSQKKSWKWVKKLHKRKEVNKRIFDAMNEDINFL